jgi:thiol-disulfide isomerase/thioredoxin
MPSQAGGAAQSRGERPRERRRPQKGLMMFHNTKFFAAAALIAAASALAQTAPSAPATPPVPPKSDPPAKTEPAPLGIGHQAPPLTIDRWVKGDSVKSFEAGQVYVVEFWATWCPPCRDSIPHLTELQKEYKDKGVTVIGVASSERPMDQEDKLIGLEDFVKQKGDEMAYRVAFDGRGAMSRAWLRAAGLNTIPNAFVVGKDSKIAWIGHPMNGLDAAVREAVAARFEHPRPKRGASAAHHTVRFAVYQPEKKAKKGAAEAGGDQKAAADAPSLALGDPAPKLAVGEWVKGDKIERFKPGQVYVVEFWATWCLPCKKSIPHLTELQKQYKDKVRFIGVSVWENDQEAVKPFVREMGDKMDYTVAADDVSDGDGKMATQWLDAAGQNTIPTAFVVNGEGKIAWIGHPNDPQNSMQKVLDQVLAGTWDVQKAAESQRQEQRLEAAHRRLAVAMNAMDADAQLAALDEILAIKPDASMKSPATGESYPLATVKYDLLLLEKKEPEKAYEFVRPLLDTVLKNDAQSLNEVAWRIVDPERTPEKQDLPLAMKAAKRAMELTENKDGMIADTLARVYHDQGNLDKALEVQEQAVNLIKASNARDSVVKEIVDRLDAYKKEKQDKGK